MDRSVTFHRSRINVILVLVGSIALVSFTAFTRSFQHHWAPASSYSVPAVLALILLTARSFMASRVPYIEITSLDFRHNPVNSEGRAWLWAEILAIYKVGDSSISIMFQHESVESIPVGPLTAANRRRLIDELERRGKLAHPGRGGHAQAQGHA